MERRSSPDHRRPSRSAPSRTAQPLPVVALVVALALLGAASAQGRPTWVLGADATLAYVEAYAFPTGVAQVDTGIFVVCDDEAPNGLNVYLWTGTFGVRPADQVEGLVRREQDTPRRHPFLTFGANLDRAAPLYFSDVDLFLDDLRRGGSMAVRLMLFAGAAEASQPTYQYDVSGFPAVEAQLRCPPPTAGAPAPAAPAPVDPFASPRTGAAAPDPFAAPATPAPPAPAPAPAPAAPPPVAPAPPAAPAAPPAAVVPPRPSAPTSPTGPAAPTSPAPAAPAALAAAAWTYIPEDDMLLAGTADYGMGLACLDGYPVALLSDVRGGTLPADSFIATFSFDPDTRYEFVELEPGFYAAITDGLDGFDGLFIAIGMMVAFEDDVTVRIASGSNPRDLFRMQGGLDFITVYEQLSCSAE